MVVGNDELEHLTDDIYWNRRITAEEASDE
jgi:hypothetical protein